MGGERVVGHEDDDAAKFIRVESGIVNRGGKLSPSREGSADTLQRSGTPKKALRGPAAAVVRTHRFFPESTRTVKGFCTRTRDPPS